MTTRELNDFLTQTGPGTAMGDLLRRYWIPALMSSELPEPDCPPVRVKLLSERLIAPLEEHLRRVKLVHAQDLREGYGDVFLPAAFERKATNASREWIWQYVFPAEQRSTDPLIGSCQVRPRDSCTNVLAWPRSCR